MTAVSGRGVAVLSRLPCHLEVGDPDKAIGAIVDGLSTGLDLFANQVGHVRKARRLTEVPTTLDLLRLAALNGIGESTLGPLDLRLNALAEADPTDTEHVARLTGLDRLALEGVDQAELAAALDEAVWFTSRLRGRSAVVRKVIDANRIGNGTSGAILTAACGLLGFDVVDVTHGEDRWWHLATCHDQAGPSHPALAPTDEVIGLEENPFTEGSVVPVARSHGDRFRVLRGGLEDVAVTTVVIGVADRTVVPMVVNVNAGQGVVYEGSVADGEELAFEHYGRVTINGADVTGSAFGFEGGVFASATETHPRDFVFADATDPTAFGDRAGTFVTTIPVPDAFGSNAPVPHGGGVVPALPMAIGESRWALFVRVAHLGQNARAAVPRFGAGLFDRSVFAGDAPLAPAAEVGFRWEEREPFAVCLHLPGRLADVDDETGSLLRQPLRALLDRHRAAGVHLRVAYADHRWVMGRGVVRDADSGEAIGLAVSGTTLWADGTPPPTPTDNTPTPNP